MVNTKMTAIADKIRSLLGITEKMGLDAMAENLEREKTNVAEAYNAISSKGGSVPSSKVSGNLSSAIASIPVGATAQTKAGTATTDDKGNVTVNCGFQPDIIQFAFGINDDDGYTFAAAADFASANVSKINTSIYHDFGDYALLDVFFTRTTTGFTALFDGYDWGWDHVSVKRKNFNYTAVKFT